MSLRDWLYLIMGKIFLPLVGRGFGSFEHATFYIENIVFVTRLKTDFHGSLFFFVENQIVNLDPGGDF